MKNNVGTPSNERSKVFVHTRKSVKALRCPLTLQESSVLPHLQQGLLKGILQRLGYASGILGALSPSLSRSKPRRAALQIQRPGISLRTGGGRSNVIHEKEMPVLGVNVYESNSSSAWGLGNNRAYEVQPLQWVDAVQTCSGFGSLNAE